MSTGLDSKGVDLDSIFAPYVTGTSPALTGVKFGGTDVNTRYAPRSYGSAAAATGITCKPGGAGSLVDLNTLFAAYGTTSYALAINGQKFVGQHIIQAGQQGTGFIEFVATSTSGWYITGSNAQGVNVTKASGGLPAGAVKVKYTWGSFTIDTNDSGGATSNGAASITALTSTGVAAYYQTSVYNDNAGTRGRTYTFTVDFYDASDNNISHTVIYLEGSIDGSV